VFVVRRCASSIDREETRREKRARDEMTGVWSAARSSVGAIAFDAAAILVASPARTDEPRPDLGETPAREPRNRATTNDDEIFGRMDDEILQSSRRRSGGRGAARRVAWGRGNAPGGTQWRRRTPPRVSTRA
jgi:hypothetical protein